jgi:NAD dependent epimerase/dehydratase
VKRREWLTGGGDHRDMKVLVTGAGGFIGSHLAELFLEEGFDVRAMVRYNSGNSWGWLEQSPYRKDLEVVTGDVRDRDSVKFAMQGCRAVLHLAALIGIPYSYRTPLAYIRTNVEGTCNVLQCAMDEGVEQVIVTSTSEVYGTAQYVPIDEGHPLMGQSPYSASKIAADQLALSFHRSYGLPVKLVRPFNTYGPRQSARAVIPTIITQILSGSCELKLGNLKPTRDLTYVKDTVRGFLEVFRSPRLFGEITNIGMNHEISVGELARTIGRLMGVEVGLVEDEQRLRPEASEVMRLKCDNSRILSLTTWRPGYDLQAGLMETIEWFGGHVRRYKPEVCNV